MVNKVFVTDTTIYFSIGFLGAELESEVRTILSHHVFEIILLENRKCRFLPVFEIISNFDTTFIVIDIVYTPIDLRATGREIYAKIFVTF